MPLPIHIVIGPTSSGKSEYAVRLAKKVKGEIISADSRQVYKGFYLASGQVPGKWQKMFVYKNIPHHCIDFVSPKRIYTVSDFVRDGRKALADILARGKTPIICGGTGLYIDALLFDLNIPEVPPDKKFREKMEKLSTEQLFARLQKLDPIRASNIDRHNPRRLIRALEIIDHTGKPVPLLKNNKQQITNNKFTISPYHSGHSGEVLQFVSPPNSDHSGDPLLFVSRIHSDHSRDPLPFVSPLVFKLKAVSYQLQPEFHYLNPPQEKLFKNIEKRLKERVKQGMLLEILIAHQKGVSWKRLEGMGLEFRHTSRFLKAISNQKTVNSLSLSRRQAGARSRQLANQIPPLSSDGKIEILDSKFQIPPLGADGSVIFVSPLNSDHSGVPLPFVSRLHSDHSGVPLPFVSLFLKSQYFQDLLSDIKKYTKRQNTWFKRYLPTPSKD